MYIIGLLYYFNTFVYFSAESKKIDIYEDLDYEYWRRNGKYEFNLLFRFMHVENWNKVNEQIKIMYDIL